MTFIYGLFIFAGALLALAILVAVLVAVLANWIHRKERQNGEYHITGTYRGHRRHFVAMISAEDASRVTLMEIRPGTDGQEVRHMGNPTSASIGTRQRVQKSVRGNKGVVMGAAVGNAIAGRAGAVIGAMHVRDKNKEPKVTYHKDLFVYFDHDDDEYMQIQDVDTKLAQHLVLFVNKTTGAVK